MHQDLSNNAKVVWPGGNLRNNQKIHDAKGSHNPPPATSYRDKKIEHILE